MEPMNYAFDGSTINLIPRSTKITPSLPAGTYTFQASMERGLWLERCDDVPEVTNKIYGDTIRRVEKSWGAFLRRERNTGVLLSGEPGMGKSMFIKLICAKAKEAGIPVILLKQAYGGITDYLAKIDTDCIVVMDEFEKNFREMCDRNDGNVHAQDGFLSLMDGMSSHRKLFIAAVNEVYNINKYMINRPGRFLYHYKFDYLSREEIGAFLADNVPDEKHRIFIETSLLAHKVNYDALAAICDEINAGMDPKETLNDLNLSNDMDGRWDITVPINGHSFTADDIGLDLDDESQDFWLQLVERKDIGVRVLFDTRDIKVRKKSKWSSELYVPADKVKWDNASWPTPNGDIVRIKDGWSDKNYKDAGFKDELDLEFGDLVLSEHTAYSGYRTAAAAGGFTFDAL